MTLALAAAAGSFVASAGTATAAPLVASCAEAVQSTGEPSFDPSRDVTIGPATIQFARRTPRQRRDAFGGHGFKLPLGLSADVTAVVSVPVRWRRSVRLVYDLDVQRKVLERGVRAGSKAVRFEACPASESPGATGWAGGIVVRRRTCAALKVEVVGEPRSIVERVPFGKRCPKRDERANPERDGQTGAE